MADPPVRADFLEMARLAGAVLLAADGVTTALATARLTLSLPEAAFGNTSAAPALHRVHEASTAHGGSGTEQLIEVLEGDVDRLYGIAFAYQARDQANADDVGRSAPDA